MPDDPLPPDPHDMTNEQLCRAWEIVNDHDNLSPFDQAVLDEMERRGIVT